MLDYSEYKSLIEILDQSDNTDAYKDLMKKEDKVLDTVNAVVNHYKEKQYKKKMFLNMSLAEVYNMLFLEWPLIMRDLSKAKTFNDYTGVVLKNNRPFFIGIVCLVVAVFLFFVHNSS